MDGYLLDSSFNFPDCTEEDDEHDEEDENSDPTLFEFAQHGVVSTIPGFSLFDNSQLFFTFVVNC